MRWASKHGRRRRRGHCVNSSSVQVLWWDTRRFTGSVDRLVLEPGAGEDTSRAQGASILEYEWTIPSKFMVGTQQGGCGWTA